MFSTVIFGREGNLLRLRIWDLLPGFPLSRNSGSYKAVGLSVFCNSSDPIVTHPSSSSSSTTSHPRDMPTEDEERIEKLFNSLDRDGNGKIDIHDLSSKLKGAGVSPVYAKRFLEMSDTNKSGDVSLKEFIHYVKEHEKNLKLVFSNFDKNKDGKLDVEELVRAFKELGIEIDHKEALKLVQRMDTDGSVSISYSEWRDFLLYAPSHDIGELIKYWRHSSAVSGKNAELFLRTIARQILKSSVN